MNNLDLGKSTDKALFKFTDEILSALNSKRHVDGMSCNPAKHLIV
jgi:hypothetical protein